MDVDINKCIKDLIRKHFCTISGRSSINDPEVLKRLKIKCYNILLSHSETGEDSWGNIFDHIHIKCFQLKNKRKAEKLITLLEKLWQMDCPEVRNALTFVYSLSNLDETSEIAEFGILKSIAETNTDESNEETQAHRICKDPVWFEIPSLPADFLDFKSAKTEAGFFRLPTTPTAESVDLPRPFSRDRWPANGKLQIPELSDDYGDQPYNFPRLRLKISSGKESKLDVDEGFEDTITPVSGISFHQRTVDDDDDHIWDQVFSNEPCYERHPPIWEHFGRIDPPLEKPLLTEARLPIVDRIVECHLSDLYMICPEEIDHSRKISVTVKPDLLIKSLVLILVAVPSVAFTYIEESHKFAINSVVMSGLSPTALHRYLTEFSLCGSQYKRLEEAVASVDSADQRGLVLHALIEGVRRYLQHVQTFITAIYSRLDVYRPCNLLKLNDDTIVLRQQTAAVADLLDIGEEWRLESLSTGLDLIQRIYKGVVGSLFNPWFITLFKYSIQPYLLFLQDWAFEGRNWDQHGEFPIRHNEQLFLKITDEKWWTDGYTMEETDDPIFGSKLLRLVFVCGKTLLILRHCYPLHPLFSMTVKRPCFKLGLCEEAMKEIEQEWKTYFERIDNQLLLENNLYFPCTSAEENSDDEKNEPTSNNTVATQNDFIQENDNATPPDGFLYKTMPYNYSFPNFSVPMVDIAEKIVDVDSPVTSEYDINSLVLPALIDRCISRPLMSQVSLVNRVVIQYFLYDLKLKNYFEYFANHFFMQDGEFSQSLCNLLFTHLMSTERPTQLLNRMTLNSILDEACAQSVGRDNSCLTEFRSKLSFSVRYVPNNFKKRSVTVLECLRLTHRADWPLTFIITAEAHKHYQYIFNFLLQLRMCLWSLSEIYHILKVSDPSSRKCENSSDLKTTSRYRHVQYYRQDMLHFIKSVHEHLNLMAFQKSFLKFQDDVERIKCIDDLIVCHNAYLKKVAFRCLLTKVALPLMKILKDVFASVLDFHWRLLDSGKSPTDEPFGTWNDESNFESLTKSYKEFKQHSSLLAQGN
ncbi:Gamma-tubulin complex component 6, variant 2 [Chamberlinius hualienensis]